MSKFFPLKVDYIEKEAKLKVVDWFPLTEKEAILKVVDWFPLAEKETNLKVVDWFPLTEKETKLKVVDWFPLTMYPFTLTLKEPIMIAADDIHKFFVIVFQRK